MHSFLWAICESIAFAPSCTHRHTSGSCISACTMELLLKIASRIDIKATPPPTQKHQTLHSVQIRRSSVGFYVFQPRERKQGPFRYAITEHFLMLPNTQSSTRSSFPSCRQFQKQQFTQMYTPLLSIFLLWQLCVLSFWHIQTRLFLVHIWKISFRHFCDKSISAILQFSRCSAIKRPAGASLGGAGETQAATAMRSPQPPLIP